MNKGMQKRETVLNFDCRCSMLLGVGQFIYLYIISFCLKVITFLDEKTTVKPPNFWVLPSNTFCIYNFLTSKVCFVTVVRTIGHPITKSVFVDTAGVAVLSCSTFPKLPGPSQEGPIRRCSAVLPASSECAHIIS